MRKSIIAALAMCAGIALGQGHPGGNISGGGSGVATNTNPVNPSAPAYYPVMTVVGNCYSNDIPVFLDNTGTRVICKNPTNIIAVSIVGATTLAVTQIVSQAMSTGNVATATYATVAGTATNAARATNSLSINGVVGTLATNNTWTVAGGGGSTSFATNATYAVTVTGPQSNLIDTAVQPATATNIAQNVASAYLPLAGGEITGNLGVDGTLQIGNAAPAYYQFIFDPTYQYPALYDPINATEWIFNPDYGSGGPSSVLSFEYAYYSLLPLASVNYANTAGTATDPSAQSAASSAQSSANAAQATANQGLTQYVASANALLLGDALRTIQSDTNAMITVSANTPNFTTITPASQTDKQVFTTNGWTWGGGGWNPAYNFASNFFNATGWTGKWCRVGTFVGGTYIDPDVPPNSPNPSAGRYLFLQNVAGAFMQTPAYSGIGNVYFDVCQNFYDSPTTELDLQTSTNGGTSWTTAWTTNNYFPNSGTGAGHYTLPINATVSTMLRFYRPSVTVENYANSSVVVIDNVTVYSLQLTNTVAMLTASTGLTNININGTLGTVSGGIASLTVSGGGTNSGITGATCTQIVSLAMSTGNVATATALAPGAGSNNLVLASTALQGNAVSGTDSAGTVVANGLVTTVGAASLVSSATFNAAQSNNNAVAALVADAALGNTNLSNRINTIGSVASNAVPTTTFNAVEGTNSAINNLVLDATRGNSNLYTLVQVANTNFQATTALAITGIVFTTTINSGQGITNGTLYLNDPDYNQYAPYSSVITPNSSTYTTLVTYSAGAYPIIQLTAGQSIGVNTNTYAAVTNGIQKFALTVRNAGYTVSINTTNGTTLYNNGVSIKSSGDTIIGFYRSWTNGFTAAVFP